MQIAATGSSLTEALSLSIKGPGLHYPSMCGAPSPGGAAQGGESPLSPLGGREPTLRPLIKTRPRGHQGYLT